MLAEWLLYPQEGAEAHTESCPAAQAYAIMLPLAIVADIILDRIHAINNGVLLLSSCRT